MNSTKAGFICSRELFSKGASDRVFTFYSPATRTSLPIVSSLASIMEYHAKGSGEKVMTALPIMKQAYRTPHLFARILPFGLCLLALCLVTSVVALTHPDCQDSTLKMVVGASTRWLPWLWSGVIIGRLHPKQWLVFTIAFFLVSYPTIQFLWMRLAFLNWRDWPHYWLVVSTPLPATVVFCLTIAGGASGNLWSDFHTRKRGVFLTAASTIMVYTYLVVMHALVLSVAIPIVVMGVLIMTGSALGWMLSGSHARRRACF